MENSAQIFQMALALVSGIGCKLATKLIRHTGSPEAIFSESRSSLQRIQGIGDRLVENLQKPGLVDRAIKEMEFMKKNNISMVFMTDPEYPQNLIHCQDAPLLIFFKGKLPAKMKHCLSVVGTRNPTQYGRDLTIRWIETLASEYPDLVIISGLAYGIDIAAHEAALASGIQTIGVLGHGFHTLYPQIHQATSERMIRQGALISDFFSHNKREPKNFIRRNRIIAGISQATLIVESGMKGGAMATAEMACSYNRDLLAVPGRPDDSRSVGCNYLIRSNQGILVSSPEEISFILGWEPQRKEDDQLEKKAEQWCGLSDNQRKIAELLQKEELNINELGIILQIHPARLTGDLLNLEFGGFIQATPGGSFRLIRT